MAIRALRLQHMGREVAIIVVSVLVGLFVMRAVAYAGSLTPSASPAATMNTLASTYTALVGTSFDSSSITASSTGSAIQIARCIATRITGGSC